MYYTRRHNASTGNHPSPQQQSSGTPSPYGGFVKSYAPSFNQSDQTPQSCQIEKPAETQQPGQNQISTASMGMESASLSTMIFSTTNESSTTEICQLVSDTVNLNNMSSQSAEISIKTEPVTETNDAATNRKAEQVQKWKEARKKQGTTKVDKKLKKKRLNARLEKVLKPKNAFLIFNELALKPEYHIQDSIQSSPFGHPIRTYTAHLQLNGKTYVGENTNIAGAKMVAADVALKDWFFNSLKKKETETPNETESEENESKSMAVDPAPWSSVGSYAMHLLFSRWQMDVSNGTTPVIKTERSMSASGSVSISDTPMIMSGVGNIPSPIIRANSISSASTTGGSKKQKKNDKIVFELIDYPVTSLPKLPAKCEQYQPLYLFNLAFPGITFVESIDENSTEEKYTLSCKINSVVYDGKARNKKEAKKKLAAKALTAMGIPFCAVPPTLI